MSREYIQPSYSISIYDYQILKVQLTQLCATAERSTIETLYEHFEDEVYPRAGILKITGKVASIAEDYFSGNGILLTSSGNVEKMALYVHHPEKIGVKLGDSVTLVCSPEYEGRVMPLQVRGWYQI